MAEMQERTRRGAAWQIHSGTSANSFCVLTQVPHLSVAWVAEMPEKDPQGRPMLGARLQQYTGPLKYAPMAEFLRVITSVIAGARGSGDL